MSLNTMKVNAVAAKLNARLKYLAEFATDLFEYALTQRAKPTDSRMRLTKEYALNVGSLALGYIADLKIAGSQSTIEAISS